MCLPLRRSHQQRPAVANLFSLLNLRSDGTCLRVVDVNGTACANVHVTQSWSHNRLYLDGNYSSDHRLTDLNGYVQFPQRTIRASLSRRIIMTIVRGITTIMHGGWVVDGTVWAFGIKDVAWFSYESGRSLLERCALRNASATAPNSRLTFRQQVLLEDVEWSGLFKTKLSVSWYQVHVLRT